MSYNPSDGAYCDDPGDSGFVPMHDWQMLRGNTTKTEEVCTRCGLLEMFWKVDNKRYLETHKRDFLQPTGATAKLFAREYGKANYEAVKNQGKADDGLDD